jgi:2-desacetyl-2-hydroxyethyl bacteriochlorophyllide A dehydrogenase
MKAIVYKKYGSFKVLQLNEIEKPAPNADEVLVKIHAASLNYGDKSLVRGKPFLVRLMGYGLIKPKYPVLGTDVAGKIESVGENVTQFEPGDEIYADVGGCGYGAFAEYVAVPENSVVLKPGNLSFEGAAAVPQAAVVALQGLRDEGRIKSGQKVVINGASGGIGMFAVQIAKAYGAEVTGICSTKNLDFVRSIGADHVIDYSREDFTQNGHQYDLIFDVVANRSVSDYLRVTSSNGTYVACAFNPTSLFLGSIISKNGDKKVSSLSHKRNKEDLVHMKELIEAGKVVPVVDRIYPLSEVAEAMRYLDQGRHQGKVVLTVENETHGGK